MCECERELSYHIGYYCVFFYFSHGYITKGENCQVVNIAYGFEGGLGERVAPARLSPKAAAPHKIHSDHNPSISLPSVPLTAFPPAPSPTRSTKLDLSSLLQSPPRPSPRAPPPPPLPPVTVTAGA